ncbi:MAG: hypothetical protein IPK02_01180 [Candidatus Accumulibacter sp.]|uniref:Uncharacterized protein n=1 Tax=Candidatus Accumulibacter affinis TaxID=2954384 RepID=A0A935W6D0_9PROT|nr:hypothetical protein [Candidatus Accumulibacter affinis]
MWIAELIRTLRKQLFCHPAGGSKFALLGEQLYQSAPECQAFDMCFTEGLARVGLAHADGQFGIAAVAVRSEALRQRAQGRQIFGEGHGFEWSRAHGFPVIASGVLLRGFPTEGIRAPARRGDSGRHASGNSRPRPFAFFH